MKRINVMVSDDAKNALLNYKDAHAHSTLDEALNGLLIEFGRDYAW